MADLVEKELSYAITGVLYSVYNELGGGFQEKYYQRAIAKELAARNISFKEQVYVPLSYKEDSIGKYFLDFLIEGKIVLEIKAGLRFYPRYIRQVLGYLKSTNIPLAILASFGRNGVICKRVLRGNGPIRDD